MHLEDVAVLAGGEQVIVAGLDDVDQLALQRPCAVPVLAGGDHFNLKLRTILGDEALEQLVRVFQFLLKLVASGIGVLAEQGEGAFVPAGGVQLEVDVVFLQEAVEVRQLADHADFEKGEPTKDIWFYEHQVSGGQKAYSMTKPIRFEHLKGCIDWWGSAKRKGRKETPQAWKVTADEVKERGYNLDIKNPHDVPDDHGDPQELLKSLNAAEAETMHLRDQLKAILAEALAR